MSHAEPCTGGDDLARSLAANRTTRAFFIDAMRRRAPIELSTLGDPKAALAARITALGRLRAEITPAGIGGADTGYSGIWTSSRIEPNGEGPAYLRAAASPADPCRRCSARNARLPIENSSAGLATGRHIITRRNGRRRGGAAVLVVNDGAGFGAALPDALATDEAVVIDAATDMDCRAPEPWLAEEV